MAVATIAAGANGNSGALAADNLFFVQTGKVWMSSDGGTTKIPFDAGDKVVFSAGLTVTYYNDGLAPAEVRYMAL